MKKVFTKVNNGLTVVELLVVISIFLVITGVTIFNYGDFRSNVSLQNLTDDIALSVRKAQSFAIGARSPNTSGGFDNSFGIHFSLDGESIDSLKGNIKSFLMFSISKSESDKKYVYNGSSSVCGVNNSCVELFKITTADYIKYIVLNNDINNPKSSGSLDVVFTRPDPRAYFCYRANTSNSLESCLTPAPSSVMIVITNGLYGEKEKTKNITIQNTGQISTK